MKFSLTSLLCTTLFLGLIAGSSSFVDTKEVAVVYRFGAMERILESGLHFHLPYPIETVDKLPIRKTHVVELGEQLILTGDANLVQVNVVAQYDVSKVEDYVLKHKNVDRTVTKILQNTTIRVLGQTKVHQETFLNRITLEREIRKLCQKELQKHKLGIELTSLGLQELSAPKAVIDAFNEISSARGEKDTMVLSAQSYSSKIIPDARGESKKIIELAKSDAFRIVSRAKERKFRYEQLLPTYKENPTLVERNLKTQTWHRLTTQENKIIVHQIGDDDDLILTDPSTTPSHK
jgi:modulator of FtsH protease HflK